MKGWHVWVIRLCVVVGVLGVGGILAWADVPKISPQKAVSQPTSVPASTSRPVARRATVKREKRYFPRLKRTEQSIVLRAYWAQQSGGRVNFHLRPEYKKYYTAQVAAQKRSYEVKQFSVFLPPRSMRVGEIWKIAPEQFLFLLRQFHSQPSVTLHHGNLDANGAYGAIRAVSKKYIEIALRVHAEFVLLKNRVYYTPACFWGRLVVDRTKSTVAAFQLHVPVRTLNVDLNADSEIDIAHVSRMELLGGDLRLLKQARWRRSIPEATMQELIKLRHYPYMKAKWYSLREAAKVARQQKKPIHLIVLFGRLDDESC